MEIVPAMVTGITAAATPLKTVPGRMYAPHST
jgi:hypothetical protein